MQLNVFSFLFLYSVQNIVTQKIKYLAEFNAREDVSNIEPWVDLFSDDGVMMFPGLPHVEGKGGNHGDHPVLDVS